MLSTIQPCEEDLTVSKSLLELQQVNQPDQLQVPPGWKVHGGNKNYSLVD